MDNKRPLTLDDLYRLESVESPRISPDGRWIAYVRVKISRFDNKYQRQIYIMDTAGGDGRSFSAAGSNAMQPAWSPDGQKLAFVSDRSGDTQIYVLRMDGGEAEAVTAATNGASDFAWSPDSTRIAYLTRARQTEREIESETEPEPKDKFEAEQRKAAQNLTESRIFDPRVIRKLPYRQGTSFEDGRTSHIYIIDVEGKDRKAQRITDGEIEWGTPSWAADGKAIYTFACPDPEADQPWTEFDVASISLTDGYPVTWFGDRTFASYGVLPSPDGKLIAYTRILRDRLTGQLEHVVIANPDGSQVRDVSLPIDRVLGRYVWAPDSSALYFWVDDYGDAPVYRFDVESYRSERILAGTQEVITFDVAPDGSLAYAAATPASPVELYYNGEQRTFYNKPLLDEIWVAEVEEVRYKSTDGMEVQGWALRPYAFDASKTYPFILNIHGGPHAMWGPSTPTMWFEWQYHAASGYVVFYCNPRGASGYTGAFFNAIQKNWAGGPMDDILSGVDLITSRGYIDTKRMAITGGSYGGYMTAWIIAHDHRFAAAVAQRGVYNLISFWGTSDVPYLIESEFETLPWEDYDALWEASPLKHAHNIQTPLLIKHSDNDFRVPISDAEQLFYTLRRMRKTVEFVRYPREGHELSRSGEPDHRVDRLRRMIEWIDRYCKS